MTEQTYYAHSLNNADGTSRPVVEWEPLYTGDGKGHLEKVAKLAGEFASKFGAEEWGYLAGLWHDLGKYSNAFQAFISTGLGNDACAETLHGRVDHSTAGAQHARATLGQGVGDLLAYVIAGHHAGLADAFSSAGQSGLRDRLKRQVEEYKKNAPAALLQSPGLTLPELFTTDSAQRCGFQLSMFCRMLFSALCDADFLATEQFMSPEVARIRQENGSPSLADMYAHLENYLASFDESERTEVNRCRAEIRQAARCAATGGRGIYSFTVPTGGGKTLSSLDFALRHAIQHDMDRVIYAIPFTSIIEQTADVFRDVFQSLGADVVLEHHSNLDPDAESRVARLVTQNWDAPLIVTTNVQLLESLFAARTSRCRKLHRIARSVIVFDEVQTLPVKFLLPCLAVMRELVEMFGCSIVLCTATQPAITQRSEFPIGLPDVREIIDQPADLYRRMKRVEVQNLGGQSDQAIADQIANSQQALCIVNTRPHASELFALVSSQSNSNEVFHLSTFMCGAHRKRVLDQVRRRLDRGKPCRVISTQLIEAGVDIDFPVVFRALTGLDSIAQAAGRCNREGRQQLGKVFVFMPEGRKLIGYLKSVAQTASEVMPLYDDMLAVEAIEHYFRLHYWNQQDQWDAKSIMPMFADAQNVTFQFRTAAQEFQLIDDASRAVFVPWSVSGRRIEAEMRSRRFADNPVFQRDVLRRAQRYIVPIYENIFRSMVGSVIELLNDNLAILLNQSMYSDEVGLDLTRIGYHEPESMIV